MRQHRHALEYIAGLWELGGEFAFPQLTTLAKELGGVTVRRAQQIVDDLVRWGYLRKSRVAKLPPEALRRFVALSKEAKRAAAVWQQNVYWRGPVGIDDEPPPEREDLDDDAGEGDEGPELDAAPDEAPPAASAASSPAPAAAVDEAPATSDRATDSRDRSPDLSGGGSCGVSRSVSGDSPYGSSDPSKLGSSDPLNLPPPAVARSPRACARGQSADARPLGAREVPAPTARSQNEAAREAAQDADQIATLLASWRALGLPLPERAEATLAARARELAAQRRGAGASLDDALAYAAQVLGEAVDGAREELAELCSPKLREPFLAVFASLGSVNARAHKGRMRRERLAAEFMRRVKNSGGPRPPAASSPPSSRTLDKTPPAPARASVAEDLAAGAHLLEALDRVGAAVPAATDQLWLKVGR